MAEQEIGAWRDCPTEIDSPIRVGGLLRPYQMGVAFFIWILYTTSELHPWSGLTALALTVGYLGMASYFSQQLAPRFLLHGLHYLQLIPFPRFFLPGLLKPKPVIYQPWS